MGYQKARTGTRKKIEAIATAFVANSLSYRLIEDPFMKNVFAELSDGWLINLPNRHDLSVLIQNISGNLRASIKTSLQNAKFIAMTIDLWSRPGYSSAMMGITCHFFDRKLNRLLRALLACRTIEQPHTGEKIYNLSKKIIDEWGIDQSRILRIVSDNGSNIVSAFRYVRCLLFIRSLHILQ